MELRLTARRSENVLVTAIIPAVVLVFFSSVDLFGGLSGDPLAFLVPGALTLAVIATSLVNLGIATGYERHYGVLKRLGGSPLTRSGLLTAKLSTVFVVEALQIVLLGLDRGLAGLATRPRCLGRPLRRGVVHRYGRLRRARSAARWIPARRGDPRPDERGLHRLPVVGWDRRAGGSPAGAAGGDRGSAPGGCALGCISGGLGLGERRRGPVVRDPHGLGGRGGRADRPDLPLGVGVRAREPG